MNRLIAMARSSFNGYERENNCVIPEECILYFLQKCWDIFHTCSITKNVQLVLWGSARFKTFFRSRRRLQKAGYHTDIKNSREVIEEGNKFTIFFLFFKNNKKLFESFKAFRSCFFQSAMLLQDIFVIDLSKKSCNDNLFGMW